MERLEELLMDMIDDGPLEDQLLEGSVDASVLPIDAELRGELQRIHAQSPLLAQCVEPPSDNIRSALQAQKVSLRATLFQPSYSIRAAGLWGGGVVAFALLLQLVASTLTPRHVFNAIERSPVEQRQPAVEQPAIRSNEEMHTRPRASSRSTSGTIESRIERSALLQRRNELRTRLSQTTDPQVREQIKRDLRRVEDLVK